MAGNPEVKISVDVLTTQAKGKWLNATEADRLVAEAKNKKTAESDQFMTFSNQAELDTFLVDLEKETDGTKKIEMYKRALWDKLKITFATAEAVKALKTSAEAKKNISDLIAKLSDTPDAKSVETALKAIDEDTTLLPEWKKALYYSIVDKMLFSKGFGYRFDVSKVVGPDGKVDEARTEAVEKLPAGEMMFATYTRLLRTYTHTRGDFRALSNAIISEYNKKNQTAKIQFGNDVEQNRQMIFDSKLPEPEKAWLLSYAKDPKSVQLTKENTEAAWKIHGEEKKATAELKETIEKETGIKDAFSRPNSEYAKDPSLYMTDAIKALGPAGIAAGIFTLIFSKWVFSGSFTGFDLIAKLGASFLGLKAAWKLGLGQMIYDEWTGKTKHIKDAASVTMNASKEAMNWSWSKIKEWTNIVLAKTEESAKQAMIWFYMSNYTVSENSGRVSFADAKVATLNTLDATNVSSLGIQKKNGTEKVELSDLSRAKAIIEELKAKRIVNLIAWWKSQTDAQTQMSQEMTNMNLIQFTVKANEVMSASLTVNLTPAAMPVTSSSPTTPTSLSNLPITRGTTPVPAPSAPSLTRLWIAWWSSNP